MDKRKYIIELEEMVVSTADGQMPLYKIKGFNTPTFDSAGVSKLIPYTELDVKAIRDEAYEKGVQDTKQYWVDAPRSFAYKLGYENGLNAAWDAVKKLARMDTDTSESITGQFGLHNIMHNLTASEAIEKIRQYEQEQEIKVGDEVEAVAGKAVIIQVFGNGDVRYMYPDASIGFNDSCSITRTGRHFSEIAEVLRKMQKEKE